MTPDDCVEHLENGLRVAELGKAPADIPKAAILVTVGVAKLRPHKP
jgi:hypothetical protein